jgi:guanylate kinase
MRYMKFASSFVAFSAPSGAGKTTIVKALLQKFPDHFVISVSATTRPARPGERDGVDYFYLSEAQFREKIAAGQFLEFEEVHGLLYGTLLEKVNAWRESGKCILFDIDVNGAQSIKRFFPEAIIIFLKPPDEAELIKRLTHRKSETPESIRRRLERLDYEYRQADKFDYVLVNDQLEDTIQQIEHIILLR